MVEDACPLSLVGFVLGVCHTDEGRTQHREDIGLHEGYQQLQTVHEENHAEAEQREATADEGIDLPRDEDDGSE